MGKILIVDDDKTYSTALSNNIKLYYPLLQVEVCNEPLKALKIIRKKGIDLLVIDLEMPMIDGMKIFQYASKVGIDKNRIIILSGRDADYLHEHFPLGTCLAVLNKFESKQQAVLDMIFSSLQKKAQVG
jgi:DNA-binding NtrC family response regulator